VRCLRRNKQQLFFCNPNGLVVECCDEYGNKTGERITLYDRPEELYANISPATGVYRTEEFGNVENYDKVILIDDPKFPISEKTVFFIDKEPSQTDAETYRSTFGRVTPVSYPVPVPDYVVWRISTSLNHKAIAVKKFKEGAYAEEYPYPNIRWDR